MKISGVDWCQNIPDNWSIIPSKYLFRDSNVRRLDGDIQLTASQKYGIISQVDYMEREQASIVLANKGLESWKHVEPLDFIISLRSFQGGLEMSEVKGCITWHYVVLKATQAIHHAYYKWLFKSAQYITALQRTCNFIRDGQDLRYSNFAKVPLPYPPVEEQKTIANFLDNKCAEIDALMEDIRVEISTLEEYKKSVITEAVTKGLNPDAEMKDSGIAWVGKCPEHWKILKIRDSISKIESGVSVNAATYPAGDNEIGVLKTSCVSKYIFDAIENKAVNKNEESRVSCPVRKGCIIVSRMNTPDLVGACGYVAEEANGIYLPDRLWQVHVKTTYSAQYVTYYLMSHIARSYYASIAVGTSSTMQNISQKEFGCMFFCVPEIGEQQAIADYLDAKCDEIAATIAEKQKQLTTLEEYKKSLIYEYVTGKKEVPTL